MEITVTRALAELKLLDKRIGDKIENSLFVSATKVSDTRINGKTRFEFENDAKANYEAALALIARRNKIKSGIVASNATTIVTINNVPMTVASAIERKSSIIYEKTLMEKMKSQYIRALATLNNNNEAMQKNIDNLLVSTLGKDNAGKADKMQIESISAPYKALNETILIDPISAYNKAMKMMDDIDGFLSEVDYALSESNSITKIEID